MAATTSVGRGATGAVVAFSVPEGGGGGNVPPDVDITLGNTPVIGDAPPSEGTSLALEGSLVPDEVSSIAEAVSGLLPAATPSTEAPVAEPVVEDEVMPPVVADAPSPVTLDAEAATVIPTLELRPATETPTLPGQPGL